MPIYEYLNEKTKDIFQVKQSIKEEKFSTMKELLDYIEGNDSCDFEWVGNMENEDAESYLQESLDDENQISRQIFLTPVVFKGTGWPSATFRNMKYTGKHKKLSEKLREERANRRSKGATSADIANHIGMKGTVDSVVPDKKWDKLSTDQKRVAKNYGFRPSKDWTR